MIKRDAFSLALTLWIVAILTLLAILYLDYGRKVVLKSKQLQTKLQVIIKNESAIELIKFYGATGFFVENRIENSLLKPIIKDIPTKIYIDSTKIVWDNSTITLQDSAGVIDMRDNSMIAEYIAKSKEKEVIIKDSIVDWYDTNDFTHLNGAESEFYIRNDRGYRPRNESYISSVDELLLVRGLYDLSKEEKERLLSNLVISDKFGYNILTLKRDILKSRYGLTENDIEQLEKVRKNSSSAFMSLFFSLSKKSIDMEIDSTLPSGILDIEIITSINNIKKRTEVLINFQSSNRNRSFEILYYKD